MINPYEQLKLYSIKTHMSYEFSDITQYDLSSNFKFFYTHGTWKCGI